MGNGKEGSRLSHSTDGRVCRQQVIAGDLLLNGAEVGLAGAIEHLDTRISRIVEHCQTLDALKAAHPRAQAEARGDSCIRGGILS